MEIQLAPAVGCWRGRHVDVKGMPAIVAAQLGQQVVDDAADAATAVRLGEGQQLGVQGDMHCGLDSGSSLFGRRESPLPPGSIAAPWRARI